MSAARRVARPGTAAVVDLAAARIARALARRARYRYVQPRVEPLGGGWKIVSPNCSRSVAPDGGEIDIAWLLPAGDGLWLLHARNHAQACWERQGGALTLDDALRALCDDPLGRHWP